MSTERKKGSAKFSLQRTIKIRVTQISHNGEQETDLISAEYLSPNGVKRRPVYLKNQSQLHSCLYLSIRISTSITFHHKCFSASSLQLQAFSS